MSDQPNQTGATGTYTIDGRPIGYTAITPFIVVNNPEEAISFYESVFGAKAKNVTTMNVKTDNP